ncbi:MAG TPA: family 10 glycosylhydrolase [Verrucomicrobiae bacterium]
MASNADWPSGPGLSVADQKAQMTALLDQAVQLHLNAVVFQVRPACDAVYNSPYEPWSAVLTGTQGKPPAPFYDPLAFAIEEAHKRGLELHAWFNPFRAWLPTDKTAPAWNQITRLHPEFIRHYGDQTWLDPGLPVVRNYVLSVVLDVVKRYDVDGVQFDDYFYPYPQNGDNDRPLDFPDRDTWEEYGAPLHLSRDDWRRANINKFIYAAYVDIKAQKPWVKIGVSPFGIWRPGYPPQIKGLDSYASLYADSRLWLASGWVDYLAPQLYWSTDSRQQSFPVLLNWWERQNVRGRGLWPGLGAAYVGGTLSAEEIARQVEIIRYTGQATGEIYFHLNNLVNNVELNGLIRTQNVQTALAPALTWDSSDAPGQPILTATVDTATNLTFQWTSADSQSPRFWVLQYAGTNRMWRTQICPGTQSGCSFTTSHPEAIAISAMDHYGNVSAPAVLGRIAVPAPRPWRKGMLNSY